MSAEFPSQPPPTASTSSAQENMDEKHPGIWKTDPILPSLLKRTERPEMYPLSAWESCLNPVTAFYNNVIDRNFSAYNVYQNVEYARHTSSRLFPPSVLGDMSRMMRTKLQEVDALEQQWINVLKKTANFFQNSPMSNYTILPPFVVISEQEQFNIAAYYSYLDLHKPPYNTPYLFGQPAADAQNKEAADNSLKRKCCTEDANEPKKKRMSYNNNNNHFGHPSTAVVDNNE